MYDHVEGQLSSASDQHKWLGDSNNKMLLRAANRRDAETWKKALEVGSQKVHRRSKIMNGTAVAGLLEEKEFPPLDGESSQPPAAVKVPSAGAKLMYMAWLLGYGAFAVTSIMAPFPVPDFALWFLKVGLCGFCHALVLKVTS